MALCRNARGGSSRSSANVRRIQTAICPAAAMQRGCGERQACLDWKQIAVEWPEHTPQAMPAEPRAPMEIGLDEPACERGDDRKARGAALTARPTGTIAPARRANAVRAARARARQPKQASRLRSRSEAPSASATSVNTGRRDPPARCSSNRAAGLGARRVGDGAREQDDQRSCTGPAHGSERATAHRTTQSKGSSQDAAVHLALQEEPPGARHGKQHAHAELTRPGSASGHPRRAQHARAARSFPLSRHACGSSPASLLGRRSRERALRTRA